MPLTVEYLESLLEPVGGGRTAKEAISWPLVIRVETVFLSNLQCRYDFQLILRCTTGSYSLIQISHLDYRTALQAFVTRFNEWNPKDLELFADSFKGFLRGDVLTNQVLRKSAFERLSEDIC